MKHLYLLALFIVCTNNPMTQNLPLSQNIQEKAYAFTQLTWNEFGATNFVVCYQEVTNPFHLLKVNGYSAFNPEINGLQKKLTSISLAMHHTFVEKNNIKKKSPVSLGQLLRKLSKKPRQMGSQSYKLFPNNHTQYAGKQELSKEFIELSESLFKECSTFRQKQLDIIQQTQEKDKK